MCETSNFELHTANLESLSDRGKTFFSLCRKSTKPELRDEQYQTLCKVSPTCMFSSTHMVHMYFLCDMHDYLYRVSNCIRLLHCFLLLVCTVFYCIMQEYDKVLKDSSEKVKLANQVSDLVSCCFCLSLIVSMLGDPCVCMTLVGQAHAATGS